MEIKEKIGQRIASLQRRERFAYHHGHLAKDRQFSYELDVVAKAFWQEYLAGKFVLFQQREGNAFIYYAVRV